MRRGGVIYAWGARSAVCNFGRVRVWELKVFGKIPSYRRIALRRAPSVGSHSAELPTRW